MSALWGYCRAEFSISCTPLPCHVWGPFATILGGSHCVVSVLS